MRHDYWANRHPLMSRDRAVLQRNVTADVRQAFPRELARSRRSGHSVALLVVQASTELDGRRLLVALGHHLRRYDVIGRLDGALVVVAPDTGREGAAAMLSRLGDLEPSQGWSCGLAVAPQDGDDLDAVVQTALGRLLITPGGVR